MDLQGLEDDPNFWNVTVSDDEQPQRTEKVREEEVDYSESHILDLTIPKGRHNLASDTLTTEDDIEQRIPPPKPAQTVSRPSPESQHQSVKPVSGDPSRKLAAPIRLPNGRYKSVYPPSWDRVLDYSLADVTILAKTRRHAVICGKHGRSLVRSY